MARLLDGVPHQVGLVLRHSPVFVAAAEAIASGVHGRPLAALLRDDQYFPIQGSTAPTGGPTSARAGGGTLLEHSIHDVDLLRWLLGEPTDVERARREPLRAPGHRRRRRRHPQVRRRHRRDPRERVAPDPPPAVDSAPRGVLRGRAPLGRRRPPRAAARRAQRRRDRGRVRRSSVERVDRPGARDRAPLLQYAVPAKAFLDALAAGRRPFPDAATALAAHRIVAAAYRSARAGGAPVGLSEAS